MKAVIDLSAVKRRVAECQPGDEYTVTFVVDETTDKGLTGTASEIEHIGGGDYEDDGEEEEMPHGPAAKGKKLPKAILMIAK